MILTKQLYSCILKQRKSAFQTINYAGLTHREVRTIWSVEKNENSAELLDNLLKKNNPREKGRECLGVVVQYREGKTYT